MKTKTIGKKLKLSKKTISNLNQKQMELIQAGIMSTTTACKYTYCGPWCY